MKDVKGKTAFVTGGSSGLGLGIAEVLAGAGMNVVITYMNEAHRANALARLHAYHSHVHAIRLDVSERSAVECAVEEAERTLGPIQLLCNNAAVSMFRPIDEATFEDVDWILGVNLSGAINLLVTIVPRMKAAGKGGHIVNISSMSAFLAGPETGLYTISKCAIRGLSESLRYSLAPYNIGVSVYCPGFLRSDIHHSSRNRPAHLTSNQPPASETSAADYWNGLQRLGMDPLEAGEFVLKGIRRNDLYIFSHTEFRSALEEHFREVLAALPDSTPHPGRRRIVEARTRDLALRRKSMSQ